MEPAQRSTKRSDYRKYDTVFEAMAWFGGQLHDGRLVVTDLSTGGAFLECAKPPELGTDVELVIAVVDEQMLRARARVVHVIPRERDDGGRSVIGAGMRFADLDATQQQLLARALTPPAPPAAPGPETTAAQEATRPERARPAPQPTALRKRRPSPYATLKLRRLAQAERPKRVLVAELVEAAKAAIRDGLYLRAATDLQLAREYAPRDLEVAALAESIIEMVNRQRAHRAWQQGLSFEEAGDPEKAERSFEEAAELCPEHAEYQLKLARYAVRRRGFAESLELLEHAARARPRDVRIAALATEVHLARGDRTQALKSAERAAELAPRDKELRRKLKALRKG